MADSPELFDRIVTEVMRAGLTDWVAMAEVSGIIAEDLGISDPACAREVAISTLAEAVSRDLLRVGTVRRHEGFVAYAQAEAIELVRRWPTDHFPVLGELPFWVEITDVGKSWLESRNKS